ncbi:MAG TPA: 50S ribosomal protein L20 [bacterium]|nr:50S ribosomal protein L20 [bacterium]HNS33911.1 50S ribosomal protein L20 [bacterium]HNW09596.1 50S ribosomal protein L20 [bacterium]HNZ72980.1 50S ribosomal protein L20 [bacterium]HOH67203.1 50S ribosomal protein L20 [bacterium]
MPRVKRGVIHTKSRKNILKKAKGYKWGRKKLIKLATTAVTKAGAYSYRDRKVKKRVNRQLWQVQLNAAAREYGLSYSQFIAGLRKAKIELDRKVLAEIAKKEPKIFAKIIEKIK